MIGFLRGILADKGDGYIIIDVNGVGYQVFVPANTTAYLNAEGEEVLVYTSMIVREDDVSLFGFSGKGELDAFKKLIGISGVGPKAAISILSAYGAGWLLSGYGCAEPGCGAGYKRRSNQCTRCSWLFARRGFERTVVCHGEGSYHRRIH